MYNARTRCSALLIAVAAKVRREGNNSRMRDAGKWQSDTALRIRRWNAADWNRRAVKQWQVSQSWYLSRPWRCAISDLKFVPRVSFKCSPPAGNYRQVGEQTRREPARLSSARDFCQQAICIDLHPFSRLVKRVIKVALSPRYLGRFWVMEGHSYCSRQGMAAERTHSSRSRPIHYFSMPSRNCAWNARALARSN